MLEAISYFLSAAYFDYELLIPHPLAAGSFILKIDKLVKSHFSLFIVISA